MIIDKKGRKFLVEGEEFHSNLGVVKLDESRIAKSHLGHDFKVFAPDFIDIYEKMPRAGSYMLLKDIGTIIANSGAGKDSFVVDAGSGSGALAMALGRVVGKDGMVHTYEKNPEFAKTASKNIKTAGLVNTVSVSVRDVASDGFTEKKEEVDIVTLDMNESWTLIDESKRILKNGGRICIYTVYIEHAKKVHEKLVEDGFIELKTLEMVEREMDFRKQGTRPKTSRVGHSGYISFGRKN